MRTLAQARSLRLAADCLQKFQRSKTSKKKIMAEGGPEPNKDTFNMATASKSLNTDSTSLVDLKAEVFRKRQEVVFNKSHGRTQANVSSIDKKKNNIWSKSNVGVLKRSTEAAEEARKERIRIQNALEQKAAVYDKLKKGQYHDKDGVFLVNFDKDNDDESDIGTYVLYMLSISAF